MKKLARQNRSVRLCWIPGHEDHFGNLKADKLAKIGASLTEPNCDQRIYPSITISKEKISKKANEIALNKWITTPECNTNKIFWPCYNKGKSKNLLVFPKCKLKRITGIVTGHCSVRKMLKLFNLADDDLCRYCCDIHVVESVEHLIGECEALFEIRLKFLGCYRLDTDDFKDIGHENLLKFFEAIHCKDN